MGISILKSLAVADEVAWSTAPTNQASYARIPAEDITWTPEEEFIPRAVQVATLGEAVSGVVGGKGGTVAFKVGLHGLATAGSGLAVEHAWIAGLMAACGFTGAVGTGTTITGAGSTTTVLDVTSEAGIAAGSIVVVNGEARLVTAVATGQITVAPALSAIPAATDVVHATASYTLTGPTPSKSVSFIAKGDGYTYTFSGSNGTVQLETVSARGRPMLAFTFSVDSWSRTTALTGTFPAMGALPTAIVARSSPVWWGATKTPVRELSFDPGLTLTAQATTEGAHGRSAWVLTASAAVATCVAYRSTDASDALQADFEGATLRSLVAQIGSTPGAMFVVAAEQAQIEAYPAEGDADGLVTLPLTLGVKSASTAGLKPYTLAFA